MLTRNVTHILRASGGWTVKTDRRPAPAPHVFRTQKSAIEAARRMMKRNSVHELVVHGRDGTIRRKDTFVLPAVQEPPIKGSLDTRVIEKAVEKVLRHRQGR